MSDQYLDQAATLCSSASERINDLSAKERPSAFSAVIKSVNVTLAAGMHVAKAAKSEIESEEFKAKASSVSKSLFGGLGYVAGTIAKTAVKIGTVPAADFKERFAQVYSNR